MSLIQNPIPHFIRDALSQSDVVVQMEFTRWLNETERRWMPHLSETSISFIDGQVLLRVYDWFIVEQHKYRSNLPISMYVTEVLRYVRTEVLKRMVNGV
jgi:hypothetical protein